MSDEDLKAELERLKAENEQLKSHRGRSVSLKVSEKGGVSVYDWAGFPSRSTRSSDEALAMADEIRAFIKDNDAEVESEA